LLRIPRYATPQTYVHAVIRAGGLPVVLPAAIREGQIPYLMDRLDGLLLSGGGDIAVECYGGPESPLVENVDRERDRAELALVRLALRNQKPLLAICRGIQVLNVACDGTLYADIGAQIPDALLHLPADDQPPDSTSHPVCLAAGSQLAAILGQEEVTVNSLHHQAARRLGQGLAVTARAPDGVVEGLEYPHHPFCVGVQWHPELEIGNQEGMERLFQALVQAAKA